MFDEKEAHSLSGYRQLYKEERSPEAHFCSKIDTSRRKMAIDGFSVSITLLKSTNFAENRDPEAHSLFRESLKEIEKYIEG